MLERERAQLEAVRIGLADLKSRGPTPPNRSIQAEIDRREERFMGRAAMLEAEDGALEPERRTGVLGRQQDDAERAARPTVETGMPVRGKLRAALFSVGLEPDQRWFRQDNGLVRPIYRQPRNG